MDGKANVVPPLRRISTTRHAFFVLCFALMVTSSGLLHPRSTYHLPPSSVCPTFQAFPTCIFQNLGMLSGFCFKVLQHRSHSFRSRFFEYFFGPLGMALTTKNSFSRVLSMLFHVLGSFRPFWVRPLFKSVIAISNSGEVFEAFKCFWALWAWT